jgi:hypothetical protein
MTLIQVIVYLDKDYKENETIYVSSELTPEEIKEKVNEEYKGRWYYYDIVG